MTDRAKAYVCARCSQAVPENAPCPHCAKAEARAREWMDYNGLAYLSQEQRQVALAQFTDLILSVQEEARLDGYQQGVRDANLAPDSSEKAERDAEVKRIVEVKREREENAAHLSADPINAAQHRGAARACDEILRRLGLEADDDLE